MNKKMGNNISLVIDPSGTSFYLYRKVSNANPPFWGITKNRIDQLNSAAYDYKVQFDFFEKSIILTSKQIKDITSNKNVAGDGDYKIKLADLKSYSQATNISKIDLE